MNASSSESSEDLSNMRVSEIRNELKERRVDFSDCFDKESLMSRLQEARKGTTTANSSTATSSASQSSTDANAKSSNQSDNNRDLLLQEIRNMSVRDLRTALAARQIRWAGLLEKEELVQTLYQARLAAQSFSPHLTPGQVGELTGDELQTELAASSSSPPPLLLDVYATWCGPCQMMAPQLQAVAKEMGETLRVGKLDSDAHPQAAGKLRVSGLPTLILFDGSTGKEIDRMEGVLMKDQLLQWIGSKI